VFHVRRDSSDFAHGKAHCGAYRIRVKLPTLWLEPGLYSLYFKAVFQGQDASEKIMSDVLHLDVGGQACGWGSIMSPDIDLKVEEVEE
jgi:lipopolysaccharide transport system ATP-binding protein